jgi:hypothetical protein
MVLNLDVPLARIKRVAPRYVVFRLFSCKLSVADRHPPRRFPEWDDGTVGTVLLRKPIRGVPVGDALISVDREKGLLLRSVSFPRPAHLGGAVRTRLKDGYRAA